jgi:hypothetical protein
MPQIPAETSSTSMPCNQSPRRCRGAQPGNLNALKHGFYLSGGHRRSTVPLDRAQIPDINQLVRRLKDYMQVTYEAGIDSKNLAETNQTLRSLSIAAIALTRLIHMHELLSVSQLLKGFKSDDICALLQLLESYRKSSPPISGPPASP